MKISNDVLQIAETFDKIMTLDICGRGIISRLYDSARKKTKYPLAFLAANKLFNKVKRGDFVFFLTGMLVRGHLTSEVAESDGPPGVAILARAIYKTLGGIPVIIIEKSLAKKMEEVMKAVGFFSIPFAKSKGVTEESIRPSQVTIIQSFPVGSENPLLVAEELLKKYVPSAIISVERTGANLQGKMHNAQGKDITQNHARTDLLVKLAFAKKVELLTIGVGDGGNEIGMGTIADDLIKWLPYGSHCQCPCKGGIIPETKVDVLVTSTVSNWGAYAIATSLAFLEKMPEAAPNSELEEKIIRRCTDLGFIDSPTGRVIESVDNIPMSIHASIANLFEYSMMSGLNKLKGKGSW